MAAYIVFEGTNGCGKTTQIQAVRDRLVAMDKDVIRLREPTRDSPFGKRIREMLARGERPDPDEEFLLFEEDRRWNMKRHVAHARMLDAVILQDRSYFSTAAYQSNEHRTVDAIIRSQERFAFIPDLVILLDMDAGEALQRVNGRGNCDAMENIDTQLEIRENFLTIYKDYGKARNIVKIDASKAPGSVTDDIMTALKINGAC